MPCNTIRQTLLKFADICVSVGGIPWTFGHVAELRLRLVKLADDDSALSQNTQTTVEYHCSTYEHSLFGLGPNTDAGRPKKMSSRVALGHLQTTSITVTRIRGYKLQHVTV